MGRTNLIKLILPNPALARYPGNRYCRIAVVSLNRFVFLHVCHCRIQQLGGVVALFFFMSSFALPWPIAFGIVVRWDSLSPQTRCLSFVRRIPLRYEVCLVLYFSAIPSVTSISLLMAFDLRALDVLSFKSLL